MARAYQAAAEQAGRVRAGTGRHTFRFPGDESGDEGARLQGGVRMSNVERLVLADPSLAASLSHFVSRRVPAPEVEDLVQATLAEALAAERAPDRAEDVRRWVHGI